MSSVEDRSALFAARLIHHATPLHYLPSIFAGGELIGAADQRTALPRAGAARRDRMLGVDAFVHLSFDLETPLLIDKLRRGMPHAVLTFDAGAIARDAATDCALLPYNTKAWRSRADLQPVRDTGEMAAILRRRDEFGRYSSLEFLAAPKIDLAALVSLTVFCDRDEVLAQGVASRFAPQLKGLIRRANIRGYEIGAISQTEEYLRACISSGQVSPPPRIEFD